MIVFYRTPDCPHCGHIEQTLASLVLAHRVVLVEDDRKRPEELPNDVSLPVLVDNGQVICGAGAIEKHLEQLEGFKKLWEKFQSDACYCDEEGNVE